MKKYMVIFQDEDGTNVKFYDDGEKAVNDADVCMVSLGGYAEVYKRQTPTEENDYEEGYTLYYAG